MAEPIATLAGLAPALRGRALRKLTRQACAGARPSESLRAQLSGGGLLSMRALRLSQALALGCRGLALRDAAGIFPAAQRRSIGDFLGVDAAKSAAWDAIVAAALPRLLCGEGAAVLLPRARCSSRRGSGACPCSPGVCWCRLECPCRDAALQGLAHAALQRAARAQPALRQVLGLLLGAEVLVVPAGCAPAGAPALDSEAGLRLLCRHAGRVTTRGLGWVRLGARSDAEAERREAARELRAALTTRCVALYAAPLLRARLDDSARCVARSVQTGLLFSREAWDAQLDELVQIFGSQCCRLRGEEGASEERLEFRAARSPPRKRRRRGAPGGAVPRQEEEASGARAQQAAIARDWARGLRPETTRGAAQQQRAAPL